MGIFYVLSVPEHFSFRRPRRVPGGAKSVARLSLVISEISWSQSRE